MIFFYTVDTTKHALQALSSIISVRKNSGIHSNDKIIISFVEKEQKEFVKVFESMGNISMIVSKRFTPIHGWSNKLIASHQISKTTNGHCLSLDCDMIVVGEIEPYLTKNVFNSRVAGKYSMPKDLLKTFFKHFKIQFPEKEPYLMGSGQKGIFYPAIGVVHAPSKIIESVFGTAINYAKEILENKMHKGIKFVGQSSVCLAIHKLKITVNPLPDEMAFHMGGKVSEPNLDINCKPSIIHCELNAPIERHYKSETMPHVRAQATKAIQCINEAARIMRTRI